MCTEIFSELNSVQKAKIITINKQILKKGIALFSYVNFNLTYPKSQTYLLYFISCSIYLYFKTLTASLNIDIPQNYSVYVSINVLFADNKS